MVVSLEEVKLYLRVDGDEEDTLITNFISAAEEICEDILRYPLAEFEEVPKVIRQAVLYAIANMYDKRECVKNSSISDTIKVMTLMLLNLRNNIW